MSEIEIAEYKDEYASEIRSLILNIQNNEFNLNISIDDQADLKDVSSFYLSGSGNFWVAKYKNAIVGTIALLDIGFGDSALRKMFVKSEYRGKNFNIGLQLLNTVVNWAIVNEISTIYLGTTGKFLAAHRFYEKNSFKEIEKSNLPFRFPVMNVDTKFYKRSL